MHATISEQRDMMCASHDTLVYMQAHFHLTKYDTENETHFSVFDMLSSTHDFFTMSFENTDEGLLHAMATRILDLHLGRHEPTTINLNSLAHQHYGTFRIRVFAAIRDRYTSGLDANVGAKQQHPDGRP